MIYQGSLLFIKYSFYLLTLSLVNTIDFHFYLLVFQEIYFSDDHFTLKPIINFYIDDLEIKIFFRVCSKLSVSFLEIDIPWTFLWFVLIYPVIFKLSVFFYLFYIFLENLRKIRWTFCFLSSFFVKGHRNYHRWAGP